MDFVVSSTVKQICIINWFNNICWFMCWVPPLWFSVPLIYSSVKVFISLLQIFLTYSNKLSILSTSKIIWDSGISSLYSCNSCMQVLNLWRCVHLFAHLFLFCLHCLSVLLCASFIIPHRIWYSGQYECLFFAHHCYTHWKWWDSYIHAKDG